MGQVGRKWNPENSSTLIAQLKPGMGPGYSKVQNGRPNTALMLVLALAMRRAFNVKKEKGNL